MQTANDQMAGPRRSRKKAEVARRILDAARSVFIARGVNDADLAEIAQFAKVGRATLYRYFDGKDALLIRLIEENWEKQAKHFRRLVEQEAGDHEAIARWYRGMLQGTGERADSLHFFHAGGSSAAMMQRLADHRTKLMEILAERFVGFSPASSDRGVGGLLLLLQMENFAVHAVLTPEKTNVERGIDLIADQLAQRWRDVGFPDDKETTRLST